MEHRYALTSLAILAAAPLLLQAQLINDECSGALALTVGATCVPLEQDAATATQSMAPVNCNPQFGAAAQANDLWYTFTGTGHAISIQATGVGDVDVVLELFNGGCRTLGPLDCTDATYMDGGTEELLLASSMGASYTFRVFPYLADHDDFVYTVCIADIGPTGIADANTTDASLRIHPNPSNGDLTITLPNTSGPVQLVITDALGRTVFNEQRIAGNGVVQLPLSGKLASGSYVLRARANGDERVRSFIVD